MIAETRPFAEITQEALRLLYREKDETMPVIEVDPVLIEEIRTYGNLENDGLNVIVEDALRVHLFHLRQQKIARERRYYEAHHSELVQRYLGKYVAVHKEMVVGSSADGHELARQMRQKYGRIPIAIIRVEESPDPPTFTVRSPKLNGR